MTRGPEFCRRAGSPVPSGFTLIEWLIAITTLGLLMAVAVPKIGVQLRAHRIHQAAVVVAGDLEQAFSIAARQRKPVRLSLAGGTYTVADRAGGTVRLTRRLTADPAFGVTTVTFSANPVDIFPSGIASQPDTVTISSGSASRRIVMTAAGQVRVLR